MREVALFCDHIWQILGCRTSAELRRPGRPGSVAQWISALDFGSKGRRFDPGRIRFFCLTYVFACTASVCRFCCRSQGTSTFHSGEALRTPLTTKLSQNVFDSPRSLPHQASATDLQGPMPCDSPSVRTLRPCLEEAEWPQQSVELVTYELELDTGSCKVSITLSTR